MVVESTNEIITSFEIITNFKNGKLDFVIKTAVKILVKFNDEGVGDKISFSKCSKISSSILPSSLITLNRFYFWVFKSSV